MLILTRKHNQSVRLLGDLVEVKVVNIKDHHSIRLGVDAPRFIDVRRSEVPPKRTPTDQLKCKCLQAVAQWDGVDVESINDMLRRIVIEHKDSDG